MGIGSKIVFLLIPLLFLIVVVFIFFAESGAWEELKDTINGVDEFVPDLGLGLDELQTGDVSIPPEHEAQIRKLSDTINQYLLGNKENCVANYGGFTELGDTFVMIDQIQDKMVMRVGGAGPAGKLLATDLRFEFDAKPCVIAGKEGSTDVTERFYKWAVDRDWLTPPSPYYKEVRSIKMHYSTKTFRNGNHINVKEFDPEPVNDQSDNFEDNGWLFTPDGKHICFFPTNKATDYDEDGIDNRHFESGGSISRIKRCSLNP
jgi:hypothetical protein